MSWPSQLNAYSKVVPGSLCKKVPVLAYATVLLIVFVRLHWPKPIFIQRVLDQIRPVRVATDSSLIQQPRVVSEARS